MSVSGRAKGGRRGTVFGSFAGKGKKAENCPTRQRQRETRESERPKRRTRTAKGERRKRTATRANDANEAEGNDTATTRPTTHSSNTPTKWPDTVFHVTRNRSTVSTLNQSGEQRGAERESAGHNTSTHAGYSKSSVLRQTTNRWRS